MPRWSARIERVNLERLQRKVLAAVQRVTERDQDDAQSAETSRESSIKRSGRRAVALQATMENAGGIYLPDRLHQVRIAVKKLRYVLEIARELSRSRALARARGRSKPFRICSAACTISKC